MSITSYHTEVDPAFLAEVRGAAVDTIRGSTPSTVLGVIIHASGGISVQALAERLDIPLDTVLETISVLESEDLCERVKRQGVDTQVLAFAAHSERNAHAY
jgi:hypothetical protein